ncbi:hypothetical protein HIM_12682 [Hirsutella minnesotensis 3608]|uniref:DDE-1 domain-containing protein n=1 Tax=Hirsutella minnesotensis 3608 TaxID=1043627 RepID=A0A0F7ZZT6_9HYPO|nr:hypothetical protein HIM_12682 [Hirsutella minnesotensis 3608]
MIDDADTLTAARLVIRSRVARRKRVTVREAAARFGVSKSQVDRAIRELLTGIVPRPPGRPRHLDEAEDDSLVAYVVWLQRGGFPATKLQLENACNSLRRARDASCAPVSRHWYKRWLLDHPELRPSYVKAVETSRKSWESSNVSAVEHFFERLATIVKDFRIGASECWNEDECGIRIGSLRDRVQVVVTRSSRHSRPEVLDPGDRESCTLIGCSNAAGFTMPAWLVFKTFPTESWDEIEAPDDVRFARSDTGFSNSEITLDWLHHFNVISWKASAQAQRTGKTLEEWFGCTEWCRDPLRPSLEEEPNVRPEHERIYRLLVIDGFTGHTSLEFIHYCIKFDIILAIFPPHSTHFLQPLDVAVFQPLKQSQQRVLRRILGQGELKFSRTDFLASFHETFRDGFTAANIISGFEKTGIFPPNSGPAVTKVLEAQLKARQAVNPAYESLLPEETRFQRAADTIRTIEEKYLNLLSSPTRAGLRSARRAVIEAVTMSSVVTAANNDRLKRIEMMSRRRQRGKIVKPPAGSFYTSVSLKEIRESTQRSINEAAAKEHRKQLRSMQALVREEKANLLRQYRENKYQVINGRRKLLTKKQWLEFTRNSDNFISLETAEEEYKRLLAPKPRYTIDVTPAPASTTTITPVEQRHRDACVRLETPSQAIAEAAEKACREYRPILAMQWPDSDASVEIITQREPGQLVSPDAANGGPAPEEIFPFKEEGAFDEYLKSSSPAEASEAPSPPSSPPVRRWVRIQGMLDKFRASRASE